MKDRVLVVGAKMQSLGWAVSKAASDGGFEVLESGVAGEAVQLDIVKDTPHELEEKLFALQPRHIVCTAGINEPAPGNVDEDRWWGDHFAVNAIGPLRLLTAWGWAMARRGYLDELSPQDLCHYVAISSNSARIARTQSAAYCASKAALSMGLRVAAREADGGDRGFIVYGYEPGLLSGTPMTAAVRARLGNDVPLTRMRGARLREGASASALAAFIVANLQLPGPTLNGCLIPFDGGEQ
jgi:NAD(P)-dependent dehydrogenase (short-subunit alcohol dehydrogenase family)